MLRLPRALASAVCLTLLSGPALLATGSPASATSTTLCRGYDGCRELGMSPAGYKKNAGTMYWRMYSGHNCTNYAAYRMVRSGMPNVRPWDGGGNATYWGTSNAEITDSVPRVGSIAWWAANVRPAGSAGHVAYVEEVVSPDEIIVSQDSWGGDFSWARITRAGGSWPSGFVHFNDVPLENTEAPSVTGTVKVGADLTASPGTWNQPEAVHRYQWLADGSEISGATDPVLRLRRKLQGTQIAVRVTATKVGFPTAAATSPETTEVQPGRITSTAAPAVTGAPAVDAALTATAGTWSPQPGHLAYQWLANGSPVTGATDPTFVPRPRHVGKTLVLRVTASRTGYDDVSAESAATAPVAPGTLTVTAAPTLTGERTPGSTLTLDPGTVVPDPRKVTVTWLRSGRPVPDATGTTYELTAADLGSRVSARVDVVRRGYTPASAHTGYARRVKVDPDLALTATPGRQRLRVRVEAVAEDVQPLRGTVRLKSRGDVVGEVTLRDGVAVVRLRDLPSGRMPLKARLLSTPATRAATVRDVVRIG